MTNYVGQTVRRPVPPFAVNLVTSCHIVPNTSPTIHLAEGTVTTFSPRVGRTPALYTISYEGGYSERITEQEIQIGIIATEKRMASSLSVDQIDRARSRSLYYDKVMKDRYDLGLEIKISHDIMWKLVLVAAMELEYEQRVEQRLNELKSVSGHSSMRYYKDHPTTYLGGHYKPPVFGQELVGDTIFSPTSLSQRVKSGIARACEYYQTTVFSDDYETRRSTRIASTSTPVTRPHPLEVGGYVALTLLKMLQDDEHNGVKTGPTGEIIKKGESDGDDKTDVDVDINPHFLATSNTIFHHLKVGKSTSSLDIQTSILYGIEYSIPLSVPLLDLTAISEELKSDPSYGVSLRCVSGESMKDLKSSDTSSFSRCKFSIQIDALNDENISDENAVVVGKQLSLQSFKNEEKAWRIRKQYEIWRHLSVISGKTIWPSWSKHVNDMLKKLNPADESNQMIVDPDPVEKKDKLDTVQVEKDHEIAQALATQSRRSRRATRGDTDNPIFYGTSQSLTAVQIIETILRLLSQSHPQSMVLLEFKNLIMGDSESGGSGNNAMTELKRIRSALGKIIFRIGTVSRIFVDSNSDLPCWNILSKLKSAEPITFCVLHPPLVERDQGETDTLESHPGEVKNKESVEDFTTSDILRKEELKCLEDYMKGLHQTELSLRHLLLSKYSILRGKNGIHQISPALIATAADERENEADTYDKSLIYEDFGVDGRGGGIRKDLPWTTVPSDPLLGSLVYRPSMIGDRLLNIEPSSLTCLFYKVVEYLPSKAILTSDDDREIGYDGIENRVVAFRARYKAVPINSVGASQNDWIVLTEAQVHAGMNAAIFYRELESWNRTDEHPYLGMSGMGVLLFRLNCETAQMNDSVHAIVAGHDTVFNLELSSPERRALMKVDGEDAFWVKLSHDCTEATRLDSGLVYRIEPQEFHSQSPAYSTCETVIEYLKSNVNIVPFLHPVDPVELNIPDYFDVIKHPMDLSTVEQNLKQGKYGRIPPGSHYSSPIAKMLYGPFFADTMLIFDNAMTFNPKGDWIHNIASTLKGLATKKIETLASKAEKQYGQVDDSLYSRTRNKPRSVYVDEDSDADMYEYESDYDDDLGISSRARRKRERSKSSKVEDFMTRAIEHPFRAPRDLDSSFVSNLPIVNDVSSFSLTGEWTCSSGSCNSTVESFAIKPSMEYEKLMMIQDQITDRHNANVRRSLRSLDHQDSIQRSEVGIGSGLHGLEYVMVGDHVPVLSRVLPSQTRVAKDRADIENILETLHEEFYAHLYYKFFSSNASEPASLESNLVGGIGTYTDGSFPPFLGRVIPTINPSNAWSCTWEIRPQFVVPALRWVLRGLVYSEHLSELEPNSLSSSENESILVPNHSYFKDRTKTAYEILDPRRKKIGPLEEDEKQEEEKEVELSEYEKMRAERVARNKERLKLLGLA